MKFAVVLMPLPDRWSTTVLAGAAAVVGGGGVVGGGRDVVVGGGDVVVGDDEVVVAGGDDEGAEDADGGLEAGEAGGDAAVPLDFLDLLPLLSAPMMIRTAKTPAVMTAHFGKRFFPPGLPTSGLSDAAACCVDGTSASCPVPAASDPDPSSVIHSCHPSGAGGHAGSGLHPGGGTQPGGGGGHPGGGLNFAVTDTPGVGGCRHPHGARPPQCHRLVLRPPFGTSGHRASRWHPLGAATASPTGQRTPPGNGLDGPNRRDQ